MKAFVSGAMIFGGAVNGGVVWLTRAKLAWASKWVELGYSILSCLFCALVFGASLRLLFLAAWHQSDQIRG